MDENAYETITYPSSKGYKNNTVSRVLFVDNKDNPTYKFKEEITFSKEFPNQKKAICIGLNPAKAEETIDTNNKRLIKLLWDNYGGYTLYNIYPQITGNKNQIDCNDAENVSFELELNKILEKSNDDKFYFLVGLQLFLKV